MLRSAPLRRSAWAPRPAKQIDYTPSPRPVASATTQLPMAAPRPKNAPWRCDEYRRLVALDPCEHCGAVGRSQAAHGDLGKGMATKTGDETCFAACGPHQGAEGCHEIIGRRLKREERRSLEAFYGWRTRQRHMQELLRLGCPPEKAQAPDGLA